MSRTFALLKLLLALLLAGTCPAGAQAAPTVAVVLSDRSSTHLEMVDILRKSLDHGTATVMILGWHELPQIPGDSRLIVAVGIRALEALAAIEPPAPVLATLLTRPGFERIMETRHGRRQFSAIYLDQSPERQFKLLRLALPDRRRVAILTGPESRPLTALLTAAAGERGLHLVSEQVSGESQIYPALQRSLGNADLLLALPDPGIYNARTISDILLTAYRYKVPVIGFSPATVRAGAVMGLYSSTAQIGAQTVDMAREVLAGRALPPPQYPGDYSISINAYVAHALNLKLDTESSLLKRLRQEDHRP